MSLRDLVAKVLDLELEEAPTTSEIVLAFLVAVGALALIGLVIYAAAHLAKAL